jgi:diacylglycerol kinase family enzyme
VVSVPARFGALREEWERVDPPRRPVLLINPRSGDGKAARAALADRARERGVEPVVLGPTDDLATLVAIAVDKGADALGMAGGDGSLATVAAAAAEHDLPFICLPAGTRNHFALDLGIVRHDLLGALDAFTAGLERRIDMAEVNGRPFLNNISLGVYGDAVQRTGYRDAKLQTTLDTLHEVLSSTAPTPELLLTE